MSRRKQNIKEIAPKLGHIYGYFWPLIRVHRRLIAGSLLALFGSVVFRLLEPWPLKVFIDYVLAKNPKPLFGWQPDASRLLAVLAISVVVMVVVRSAFDYFSNVGFFVIGNRVLIKVRDRLYRHMQNLSMSFHTATRTGELIILVTRDVSLLRDITATAVLPLLASTAVLLGMLIVMAVLSWKLTLLALITLPLFWLTTIRMGRRIREAARKQRQREGAMAATAAEAMGAIEVIKAMGLEDRFARQFSQRNQSSQKQDLKASRFSVRLGRTIDMLLGVSTALVMWFGGRLALAGELSAGDIIVFLTYLKRSFKPAQEFAKYIARLSKAAAAGERVIRLLETKSDVKQLVDAKEAPAFDGAISFQDITFSYEPDRNVLNGLSLDIHAGETIAIVGPSGEGKTTLLSLVLRLHDPCSGAVVIDGVDIQQYKIAALRRQISVVLQDSLLFADTVYENIACGAEGASRESVMAAATLANAMGFIEELPNGFETKVGERGATFSRGQRQRLAVARAAVRHSPILLLDEPTTGLDEDNERALVDAMLKLAKDRTTLIVSHNLALACQADRIAFMKAGRIVELGTHEQLWNQQGRYAKWFNEQQVRKVKHGTTRLSVVSPA